MQNQLSENIMTSLHLHTLYLITQYNTYIYIGRKQLSNQNAAIEIDMTTSRDKSLNTHNVDLC